LSDGPLAYDPLAEKLILFGGENDGSNLSNTWGWTGATWARQHPLAHPPASTWASMAFDSKAGQLLLLGGASPKSSGTYTNTTWLYEPARAA
jgi:hypothetical protein